MISNIRSQVKDVLSDFCVAINREVNIRNGDFNPVDAKERRWRDAGPCYPSGLDTIEEAVRV